MNANSKKHKSPIERITESKFAGNDAVITALPPAGSSRLYFRLDSRRGSSIAVYGKDLRENRAFLDLAEYFAKRGIPVPKILATAPEGDIYLLEDLGDRDLLSYVLESKEKYGLIDEQVVMLYKQAVDDLVKMQMSMRDKAEFKRMCPVPEFNAESVMFDLNYFKYYLLLPAFDTLDEFTLQEEFRRFAEHIAKIEPKGFMYRDFQARNIMIDKNDKPGFIDFQGGRFGPVVYDIASLVNQTGAGLPYEVKELLIRYYHKKLIEYVEIDFEEFTSAYRDITAVRILQTLGAYGRRGLMQGKKYFLESLPRGIAKAKDFFAREKLSVEMPYLKSLIEELPDNIKI